MGNKEDGTGEDEEEAGNPDDDMADFLQDIDLHDVDLTNVDLNGSGVMECEFEDDDDFQPIDVFATDSPINISIYVPKVQENENTYETFCRRTQDTSWVPFAAMKDASSWTPLDKAEHKLFDEMLPSHSRNAGLESTKGYKTFAKAWDLQIASLYSAAVSGDSDIQGVNRKSYTQLQQHFDNLKKHQELLAESASINNDEHMRRIKCVFKDTRRELPPHQSATPHLTTITYNPQLGRPQFGVPMALNTTTAAGAFHHDQNSTVGPPIMFRTAPTMPAVTATRSQLGKFFKSSKCCWCCGFQKRVHIRSGTSFGDRCAGNCGYEQCSKCNQRMSDCHSRDMFGPHCPMPAVPTTQANVADWWKEGNQTGAMQSTLLC